MRIPSKLARLTGTVSRLLLARRSTHAIESPNVLAEYLGGLSLNDEAAKIGIDPESLSRLLDGSVSIDANLASKIGTAFETSAELWTGLQSAHDANTEVNQVSGSARQIRKRRFESPPGTPVSPEEMDTSLYLADWEAAVPVGREFGSPDYERLEELDNFAFKAKGSMLEARRWLDSPNDELGGLMPEEVARLPAGFERVKLILES